MHLDRCINPFGPWVREKRYCCKNSEGAILIMAKLQSWWRSIIIGISFALAVKRPLRGAVVTRTYGTYKTPYIFLFNNNTWSYILWPLVIGAFWSRCRGVLR